jgi:hypothetical protein
MPVVRYWDKGPLLNRYDALFRASATAVKFRKTGATALHSRRADARAATKQFRQIILIGSRMDAQALETLQNDCVPSC